MKFPEWLPDRDEFENPGLVECLNVIGDTYYRPIGTLTGAGTAMDDFARGAFSMKDEDGVAFNFTGDETKLYQLQAGDLVEINSGYATGAENVWNFAKFGPFCIATNRDDNIQKFDVSSDLLFSDLGGSPPKAKELAVVGDFLVLGNIEGAPNRIQWSGINDIEQWTSGVSESGSQDLPEGGTVLRITSGEFGLIFQENNITRMNYQGPPLNFSFDVVETGRGALTGGGVVQFGILTYYISQNGFYVTDGTQSFPISTDKVDAYFFNKLDETLPHKITAIATPAEKIISWSYVGKDSLDGLPNWLIIYNWELKRWSEASINTQIVFTTTSNGLTLEELDALHPDLDAMTTSLDSRIFKGGVSSAAAIDENNQLATFTGAPMAARIKTGEYEFVKGQKSVLTQVWPQIDGDITVTITKRANYQETAAPTGAIGVNSLGFAPFTENGRYHSFQFDFENWTSASGFEFRSETSGEY